MFEASCFRKLKGFLYRDHIANEEVKSRIRNAVGPHEDLLTQTEVVRALFKIIGSGKDYPTKDLVGWLVA